MAMNTMASVGQRTASYAAGRPARPKPVAAPSALRKNGKPDAKKRGIVNSYSY